MAEQSQNTQGGAQPSATPSNDTVTFTEAPSDRGFDRMFSHIRDEFAGSQNGDALPPAPKDGAVVNDSLFDAGDGNEGDDVVDNAGEGGVTPPPAAVSLDPATLQRLASVEQTNAQLAGLLGQMLQSQRDAERESIMTAWEDAVASGDVTAAAALRTKLANLDKQAPVVAPTPAAPAAPSDDAVIGPVGHWAHTRGQLRQSIERWQSAQNWWGVDGALTQAVKTVAGHVDPLKFPSSDAYAAAVVNAANETLGRKKTTGPSGGAQQPQPRVSPQGNSRGNAAPRSGGEVTRIAQLPQAIRKAAEDAIRYGGISEAEYLASYNDVVRTQGKGRKR